MKTKSIIHSFAVVVLLLTAGCFTTPFVVNPETRSTKFTVDRDFGSAFRRAVQTVGMLGGSVTSQDAKAGTMAATVHNAVSMTVTLNSVSPTKTEVSVWGSTIPGKVVVGVFTEVDDFQRIYVSEK